MKKKNYKKIYIFTIFNLIIFITITLFLLNKSAMPYIKNYTKVKIKTLSIEILKATAINEVNEILKNNSIMDIKTNNKGEIETLELNTVMINEALLKVAKASKKRLKEIEEGKNLPEGIYKNISNDKLKKGIIYEVPISLIFKNNLLNNIGPKIPVKVEYTGNVGLDIKTRVNNYGINSALIEVYILMSVDQTIIMPFNSQTETITSEIPLIMKVIKGDIPSYISNYKDSYNIPIN